MDIDIPTVYRQCTCCGCDITDENKVRHKRHKNGIYTFCTLCHAAKRREWGRLNPVLVNLRSHRRRAHKLSLPYYFTDNDWYNCLDYWNNRCAFCGKEVPLTLDHFIPLHSPFCPGTIKENVIPLCPKCNSSKNSHNPYKYLVKRYGVQKSVLIYNSVHTYFNYLMR